MKEIKKVKKINKLPSQLLEEAFIPEHIKREIQHYDETRIPRCMNCKTNMIRIDNYSWKHKCECSELILCMVKASHNS